jgi:hypothetical protein
MSHDKKFKILLNKHFMTIRGGSFKIIQNLP